MSLLIDFSVLLHNHLDFYSYVMHTGYPKSRGTTRETPSTRIAHSSGLLSRWAGILLLHSIWLFIDRFTRYDHVCVHRNDVYDIHNALLWIVRDCKVTDSCDYVAKQSLMFWCLQLPHKSCVWQLHRQICYPREDNRRHKNSRTVLTVRNIISLFLCHLMSRNISCVSNDE